MVEDASGPCLFLQRDPFGYEDSVNLYAGLANDPINRRDPTGTRTDGLPWATLAECLGDPANAGAPSLQARCHEEFADEVRPGLFRRLVNKWDALWEEKITAPVVTASEQVVDRKLDELAERSAPPADLKDVLEQRVLPRETFREGASTAATGVSEGAKTLVENEAMGAALKVAAKTGAIIWKAAGSGKIAAAVAFDSRRAGHIFREAPGHVNPTTKTWTTRFIREFEAISSDPVNLRTDAVQAGIITQQAESAGVQAFTKITSKGRQVWVTVLNGVIQNAGINRGGGIR